MMRNVLFALLAAAAAPAAAQPQAAAPASQVFFGVRPGEANSSGAAIAEVVPGGTGAALGLQSGDVIVWMNGAAVASTEEMIERIRALRVGEQVTVRVRRGSDIVELSAKASGGTPVTRPRRVG